MQECQENDPPLASTVQEYVEEDLSQVRRELENLEGDPLQAENLEMEGIDEDLESDRDIDDDLEPDLESDRDSDDDLEPLVLDSSEDEEVQMANSVQRRKDIIAEFDSELLQSKVSFDDEACESKDNEYVLMKSNQLSDLIEEVAMCIDCHGRDFKIEKKQGNYNVATSQYKLKCMNETCGMEKSKRACTNRKLRGKEVSDLVARFCYASIESGIPYSAMVNIFSTFNLKVPSLTQTNKVNDLFLKEIEEQGGVILERCRKVVFQFYEKYVENSISQSGKAMIVVCFDGSWKTRGHHSHIGIGFVIDMETNLVIDFHVLCNYCQACANKKSSLKNKVAFNEWKKEHKEKGECDQNFPSDLSSGSMEPEIASILWERSKNRNLWYKTMLADGDSKSFSRVKQLSPYGDITIEKEECHNHVNKRMKKFLTKLAKDEKLGKSKEKEGALTDKKIAAFSNFYNKAIKENIRDTKKMKDAIKASFMHHLKSTNREYGIHDYCPIGKDSWCFKNKSDYTKKPIDKSKFTHHISSNVLNAIFDSKGYKDLTSENFLQRCTGKTQNTNESLHSRVWRCVPKETFKSVRYVKIAMWLVTIRHNLGVVEQTGLLKSFDTPLRIKTSQKMEKRRQAYTPSVSRKKKKARMDEQKKKRQRGDYVPGGGD